MLSAAETLFWVLSIITIMGTFLLLIMPNPIFSAFFLTLTMLGIAGLFVTLEAYFLAVVQIAVYAGAVLVLFLMVLMIFDLKKEKRVFNQGLFNNFFRVATAALLSGIIIGLSVLNINFLFLQKPQLENQDTTTTMADLLFSKHFFAFELMGVLLLVVAVGVVALSRSKGGTHEPH